MRLEDVDLASPESFVAGVPHEAFAVLRREAPSTGTRSRRAARASGR